MIDIKTMAADEMIKECLDEGEKFSPHSPYPYAFGGLSTYVRWLVEERDRLQGIVTAFEFQDDKRREDARDMLQEIRERSADLRGEV